MYITYEGKEDIHIDSYKKYSKRYFETLKENSDIEDVFNNNGDTSEYELLLFNLFAFAANKDLQETLLLNDLAKQVKDFKEFSKKSREIIELNRGDWLDAENETIEKSLEMRTAWAEMVKIGTQYWMYNTMRDNLVRDEHVPLDGLIFRIGDPEGDRIFPPNGYRCRCYNISLTENYIQNNKIKVSKGADYLETKDKNGKYHVHPDFRFNPTQQLLPYNNRTVNYKTFGV